jgi:hypothetical protein
MRGDFADELVMRVPTKADLGDELVMHADAGRLRGRTGERMRRRADFADELVVHADAG